MSNSGSKWLRPSTRWAVYHRDDFKCVYCQQVGGSLTLDHVRPLARGRKHCPTNLVTCCLECNSSKKDAHGKSLTAWLNAWALCPVMTRARIRKQTRKKLNREVGRYLSRR